MKINAKELKQALRTVGMIPSRTGVTSSEYIRIKNRDSLLTLSLASEAIGRGTAKTDDAKSWMFYADRKLLDTFVSNVGDDSEITFSATPKGMQVRARRRSATFQPVSPASGYGDMVKLGLEKAAPVTLDDEQRAAVALALKYAPPDTAAPNLSCVYLAGDHVLASNGYITFAASAKIGARSIALPVFYSQLLQEPSLARLLVLKGQGCCFEFSNGKIFQPLNQEAESFPHAAVLSHLEKGAKQKERITADATVLAEALTRMGKFVGSTDERDAVIAAAVRKGETYCTLSLAASQCEVKEQVKLVKPATEDWDTKLALPYLSWFASACSGPVVVRPGKVFHFFGCGTYSLIHACIS